MSPPPAPLFSVVIPTYNRAGLLAETLASVWQQRFTDFEVIVVDDGSSDGTEALLRAHEPRLTWHRQERCGPGAARNLGARHAGGQYLAFLDSDDLWFPWTLDTYAGVIQTALQPALVVGTPTNFSAVSDLDSAAQSPLNINTFADYFASHDEWRWWGAGAVVVRRDAFESVGGFASNRINGEDVDLVMRLGTSPGFVQIVSPSTFGYRIHAVSAMANFDQSLDGARHLLETELAGAYPGGDTRAQARRQILSRNLRSVMLTAVQQGRRRDAWRLYLATFRWHLSLGRWRFLVGFPLLAARRVARK